MKRETKKRLLIEFALATMFGLALSSFLYSQPFRECCRDNVVVEYGTLPAAIISMLIGGGVHTATRIHFTIGLIIELWLLWSLARSLFRFTFRRTAQQGAQERRAEDNARLG